jgi:hypothetical protein
MIKDSLNALGASTRDALRNWRGLLLLSVLYLLLLACVYFFFSTGVASVWQLVVTAVTFAAAPVLFFALQAAAANFALPGATFGTVARRTPRDFLKVLLLALPLIALAVLFVYLLTKLQGWLPKIEEAPHGYVTTTGDLKPAPLYWQNALVSSLWLLLLGLLLPLMAAHLWLSTARAGLAATLKGIHRVLGRAFAGQSVLIYGVGLFVFGLMPYFVLFTRTPVSNGWTEMFLFGLRLLLAFVLTLWGWAITLGALARVTPGDAAPVVVEPAPAPPPEQAPPPLPEEPAAVEPQLQA